MMKKTKLVIAGAAFGALAVIGHYAIAASTRGGGGGGGGGITSTGTTDNAIVKGDGVAGNLQDTGWTMADTDILTAGGDIDLNGNAINSTGGTTCVDTDNDGNCEMEYTPGSSYVRVDPDDDGDWQFYHRVSSGAADLSMFTADGSGTRLQIFGGETPARIFGNSGLTIQTNANKITYDSSEANGASAVAHLFDTVVTYTTAGAKIASFATNSSEKAYVDKDGVIDSDTGFSVAATPGVTDSTSYWLCSAADCSTKCQVDIDGGIIVGCS